MGRQLNGKEMNMVQRFFDYELSPTELDDFQRRMGTDADFRREVEHFQDADILTNALAGAGANAEAPPQLHQVGKPATSRKWMGVMGALLLIAGLVTAAYFWQQRAAVQTEERIYASVENYVDKMSDNILRGDGVAPMPLSPIQQIMSEAREIASNNTPAAAVAQLKDLLAESVDSDSKEVLLWWLVRSQLAAGDRAAAKESLGNIANNPDFNSSRKAGDILEEF